MESFTLELSGDPVTVLTAPVALAEESKVNDCAPDPVNLIVVTAVRSI